MLSSPRKINFSEVISSPVGKENKYQSPSKDCVDDEFDERNFAFKSQHIQVVSNIPSPNRHS